MAHETATDPLPKQQSPGAPASTYVMLALVWVIYFCFGTAVFSLVPIVDPIRNELSLSYTQIGLVLGGLQLVYILAAIPAGVVIDRIGAKNALTLGAAIIVS